MNPTLFRGDAPYDESGKPYIHIGFILRIRQDIILLFNHLRFSVRNCSLLPHLNERAVIHV